MTPERLRAYVTIVTRDVLAPGTGLFLAIFLAMTGTLEFWHLSLIVSLVGVPLVAPRGESQA